MRFILCGIFMLLLAFPVSAQDRATSVLRRVVIAAQVTDGIVSAYRFGEGLHEANPALRWTAHRPLAFAGVKVAGYTATDLALARLAKENRTAAIALSIGILSIDAVVIAHNMKVVR